MNVLYGVPIVFACVYLGRRKARAYSERRVLLEALHDDINRLLNSMEYAGLPLKRIISTLAPCKAEEFWDCLLNNMASSESLYNAYSNTAEQLSLRKKGFDKLTAEDKAVLNDFFASLGKGSIDREKSNAALALERLQMLRDEARENEKKNSKLYSSLGLLLGLAFVLILL